MITDILAVGDNWTQRVFDTSSMSFVFSSFCIFLLSNMVKGNVYNEDSIISPLTIINKSLTHSSNFYSSLPKHLAFRLQPSTSSPKIEV